MTNIDLTNSRIAHNLNGAGHGVGNNNTLHAIAAHIGGFLRSFAKSWAIHRRYCALNSLSDGQLARLGLQRQDIARHLMFGDADNAAK